MPDVYLYVLQKTTKMFYLCAVERAWIRFPVIRKDIQDRPTC